MPSSNGEKQVSRDSVRDRLHFLNYPFRREANQMAQSAQRKGAGCDNLVNFHRHVLTCTELRGLCGARISSSQKDRDGATGFCRKWMRGSDHINGQRTGKAPFLSQGDGRRHQTSAWFAMQIIRLRGPIPTRNG